MFRAAWGCALAVVVVCGSLLGADDLKQWKHRRVIQIDTSASGANVSADVTNFPLHIALKGSDVDF